MGVGCVPCSIQSRSPALAALSDSDVLVIGAGPAALVIAAELAEKGLAVTALAPADPRTPWVNTYGIWADEVEALGLSPLLSHRWLDTVSYFGAGGGQVDGGDAPLPHGRAYGLFDKALLQGHLLERFARAGGRWQQGLAAAIEHDADGSSIRVRSAEGVLDAAATSSGEPAPAHLRAALVIDATGHDPVFVRRDPDGPVAGQAAYGIVGRFSAPPIAPGQFVFMDYRADHLSEAERREEPPTFLYAMDLGEGVFFVEETSLALAPAVPFALLRERLNRRLAHRGVKVLEIRHEEFCLFPMNPPLPDLQQRVVGFGGAASMVHPASGYLVGGLLRRAPGLAAAVDAAWREGLRGEALSRAAWQGLWPASLRWRHAFYRFGLEKLMRFDEARLRHHFATFFSLPSELWYGFLTNTLEPPRLLAAMVRLFGLAPWDVRWGLMGLQGREAALLAPMLRPGRQHAATFRQEWRRE
jgi:lycopene cyclase-like protein